MNRRVFLKTVGLGAAGLIAGCGGSRRGQTTSSPKHTIADLQAAFNGESNARAKYLGFAEAAKKDGYPGIATLFIATADAEKIHLTSHAEVLKAHGQIAKADIKPHAPEGIKANLLAAIKGETYEFSTMYPEFIQRVEAGAFADAKKSFSEAKEAEKIHAKMYQKYLNDLPNQKGKSATIHLCPFCGYLTDDPKSITTCPICQAAIADFKAYA